MNNLLKSKTAVVTGSTSGIGEAIVKLFANQGANVVVNGRRKELGERIAKLINSTDANACYCYADVSKEDDVKKLIQFTIEKYGQLDILVNNALYVNNTSITEQFEEDWDKAFSVMVKSVFLCSKHAIPEMIKRGGGSIVNMASVRGLGGGVKSAPYAATKAAVINLSKQMAVDYGKYNIRVNALCPGRILTEQKKQFLKDNPDEERRQNIVYPLGRAGTVDECAHSALFLASEESSFISGHALVVDGGLSAVFADDAAKIVENN